MDKGKQVAILRFLKFVVRRDLPEHSDVFGTFREKLCRRGGKISEFGQRHSAGNTFSNHRMLTGARPFRYNRGLSSCRQRKKQ
jgi:hypothetical protein